MGTSISAAHRRNSRTGHAARRAPAAALAALALVASCAVVPTPLHAQQSEHVVAPTTTTPLAPTTPRVIVPQVWRRAPIEGAVVISAVDASIAIDDQIATTTLTLSLTNPSTTPQEARIILPTPDGVAIRSLQYDGVGPEPVAEVLPRDQARAIYDEIVRSMRDPALVEFVGYNLIRTSAFPIPPGATQKLSLVYEQVLPASGGRVEYVLPRSQYASSAAPPWTIRARIATREPLDLVHSTSHAIRVERPEPGRAIVTVEGGGGGGAGAFRLSYATRPTDPTQLAYTLLTYPDAPGEVPGDKAATPQPGGYFLLVAAPPAVPKEAAPQPREVVLVLDRSGSMRGTKLPQAVNAAIQVVDGLRDGERFNIIDYSDSLASFAPAPVAKDAASAKAARAYLQALEPGGGTNIHDALLEALRTPTPAVADGGLAPLPMVLFLTDGIPTIGERSEAKIRDAVLASNASGRRVFGFGVGHDVNFPLLNSVSVGTRGAVTVVDPEADVEVAVSQVFRRLSGPIVMGPTITSHEGGGAGGGAGASRVRDVMPHVVPDVFEGEQIVLAGRYLGTGPMVVRIAGTVRGEARTWDVPLDPSAASTRHGFVPRIWATRRIAYLTEQVRQLGAEPGVTEADPRVKELTDEIVGLSVRWGVLSEYTAFLARENVRLSNAADVLGATTENFGRLALRTRAGAGGAAQQADYAGKAASGGVEAAAAAPAWRNIRNEVESTDAVLNVANQSFFRRDEQWIDSRLVTRETLTPTRRVEFGSQEYLDLAQRLARDGEQGILAQAGELVLMVDSDVVLVLPPA